METKQKIINLIDKFQNLIEVEGKNTAAALHPIYGKKLYSIIKEETLSLLPIQKMPEYELDLLKNSLIFSIKKLNQTSKAIFDPNKTKEQMIDSLSKFFLIEKNQENLDLINNINTIRSIQNKYQLKTKTPALNTMLYPVFKQKTINSLNEFIPTTTLSYQFENNSIRTDQQTFSLDEIIDLIDSNVLKKKNLYLTIKNILDLKTLVKLQENITLEKVFYFISIRSIREVLSTTYFIPSKLTHDELQNIKNLSIFNEITNAPKHTSNVIYKIVDSDNSTTQKQIVNLLKSINIIYRDSTLSDKLTEISTIRKLANEETNLEPDIKLPKISNSNILIKLSKFLNINLEHPTIKYKSIQFNKKVDLPYSTIIELLLNQLYKDYIKEKTNIEYY